VEDIIGVGKVAIFSMSCCISETVTVLLWNVNRKSWSVSWWHCWEL